jgi:hypothetical protein
MEVTARETEKVLFVRRWRGSGQTATVFHFGSGPVSLSLPFSPGRWERLVDSSDGRWGGPGSPAPESLRSHGTATLSLNPLSFALFSKA